MTMATGLGYGLISLGPALSLFVSVIAKKPSLILTLPCSVMRKNEPSSTASSFHDVSKAGRWMKPSFTILFLSPVWSMEGLSSSEICSFMAIYVFLIFTSVGFQEATRLLFWKVYNLLTSSFGPATYVVDRCSCMPFFLISAIIYLGFTIIHTFSMVIASNGYAERRQPDQVVVPIFQMLAAGMTLINLATHYLAGKWYGGNSSGLEADSNNSDVTVQSNIDIVG